MCVDLVRCGSFSSNQGQAVPVQAVRSENLRLPWVTVRPVVVGLRADMAVALRSAGLSLHTDRHPLRLQPADHHLELHLDSLDNTATRRVPRDRQMIARSSRLSQHHTTPRNYSTKVYTHYMVAQKTGRVAVLRMPQDGVEST